MTSPLQCTPIYSVSIVAVKSAQSGNPYGGGQGRRGTRTIWGLFAIRAMLPNKPRGVPRVNDRRVLNGLFVCHGNLILTLRALVPLADAPVTPCHGYRAHSTPPP